MLENAGLGEKDKKFIERLRSKAAGDSDTL
jgi:hypothetical protein